MGALQSSDLGSSDLGPLCVSSMSQVDCSVACANLTELCKSPSTQLCAEVCAQVSSYCSALCTTSTKGKDYKMFGCLAHSSSCSDLDSCDQQCLRDSTMQPVDLGH